METKQRLSSIQQIKEQIALIQPHPQIRRTSSTTPVPATPTSRVRPHRKAAAHNRYRLNSVSSRDDDDDGTTALMQQHETQGIFTSAPATPESQQNLIVQNLSHDRSSPVSLHVTDPLPEQFSPVLPSSATSNQECDQDPSNQQPPDQYLPNQQPVNQYPPDQHLLDQYPPNEHPLNQHSPNQQQQQPPDQIPLQTSPTS